MLLEFEKTKKFIGFNNYRYVFVGNRPIDKIEDMSNVIISRNYEGNLEKYPQLTSFTGWYTLWKHNLIDSEYVNLFEYDINYVSDFETNLYKFYYEKSDMIGYIPFPANHNMFVRHKPFINGLFNAIKSIYRMDIGEIINEAVESKTLTYWSSTSNTTVNNAVVVRLVHIGAQEHLITIADGAGTNIGTITILNNSEMMLEKRTTDTLQVDAGSDVKAVSVAYKN